MTSDLRKTSIEVVGILRDLAAMFPPRSPGRKAIARAMRRLKLDYIATGPQKRQIVYEAIAACHTRTDDIAAVTGIVRVELEILLAEMVDVGQIEKTRESPLGGGPGRPFDRYRLILEKRK